MEYLELVICDLEDRMNAALAELSARIAGKLPKDATAVSLGVALFPVTAASKKQYDDEKEITKQTLSTLDPLIGGREAKQKT